MLIDAAKAYKVPRNKTVCKVRNLLGTMRNKFQPPAHVFAILDMRHNLPGVRPLLDPTVVERRVVEARLHGHVPAARRVRHQGAAFRPVHHPRRQAAEALRHVPNVDLPVVTSTSVRLSRYMSAHALASCDLVPNRW